MAKRYLMAVHDFTGKRLCTIFDSTISQIGCAYSIKINKEISGWKDLEFTVNRYDADGNYNYRCDYLNNENHIYVYEDDALDIYCIKTPVDSHESNKMCITCSCNHISEELKARNLYKYFDDENGIGTCTQLINKAIGGSGWTLGECDTFYETDGITEKVRSYTCDTKTGAYNMISGICKLFDARPVFHGGARTVDIRANSRTDSWMEISFGKNINKIKVSKSSSSLVTRLYVEGEYGDYGYVGIDDINPTGLPFILNFDHFKEIGVFTDTHQEIVDEYLVDYKEATDAITAHTALQLEQQARLFELIGGSKYVYYPITDDRIHNDDRIIGNGMTQEEANMSIGDKMMVVPANGDYFYDEYSTVYISDAICIFKFVPVVTGLIATYEDKIKAGEIGLESNLTNLNKFLVKEGYSEVTIQSLKTTYRTQDLSEVKDDGFDLEGLPEQYRLSTTLDYVVAIGISENALTVYKTTKKELILELIDLVVDIKDGEATAQQLIDAQTLIENNFVSAMGSMLRDGYWSDTSYVPGQEEALYQDALGISGKMGKPIKTYTVDVRALHNVVRYIGFNGNLSYYDLARYNEDVYTSLSKSDVEVIDEEFDVAQAIHIYDKDLGINDYCISTKVTLVPDNPSAETITVDTDLIDVANKSFSTVLEHVTEMAEDVRRNRNVYKRAAAISSEGKFRTDMLDGAIDVMKTQLLSSASNWKTDDNGNILLEALDGLSAMMLAGGGFMIANNKNDSGEWEWRTFGTGEGFAADMITTGFLSSERIEAKSITVNHLASDVGENLDLSSNESIVITADKINAIANDIEFTANDSIVTLVTGSEPWSNMETSIEQTEEKIALIVSGDSTTELILTEEMLQAIANKINIMAQDPTSELSTQFTLTPVKLETVIQNSGDASTIKQTIRKIDFAVTEDEDTGEFTITPEAIDIIADNITIDGSKIDISANQSITLVAGKADKAQNDIDNLSVGGRNYIRSSRSLNEAELYVEDDDPVSSEAYSVTVPELARRAAINSVGGKSASVSGVLTNYSSASIVSKAANNSVISEISTSDIVERYFPDGMKSAGTVYDEIDFDRMVAIKRIGSLDMGTLNWGTFTGTIFDVGFLAPEITDRKAGSVNIQCAPYTTGGTESRGNIADKTIHRNSSTSPRVAVRDDRYTTASDFKAAMDGVILNYELAEPIETPIEDGISNMLTTEPGGSILFVNDKNTSTAVSNKITFGMNMQEKLGHYDTATYDNFVYD